MRVLASGAMARVGGRTKLTVPVSIVCEQPEAFNRLVRAGHLRDAMMARMEFAVVTINKFRASTRALLFLEATFELTL